MRRVPWRFSFECPQRLRAAAEIAIEIIAEMLSECLERRFRITGLLVSETRSLLNPQSVRKGVARAC